MKRGEYIAISVTHLDETYYKVGDVFKQFREMTPVAKVGYSIYIYTLPATVRPVKMGEPPPPPGPNP
jgi:hypothetical protein